MFVLNGIVYGGEPMETVKITDLKILLDKMMILTFSNGEKRLFDAAVLQYGVFEALNEETLFHGAVIGHGVVTWADGEIDCSPEFMYQNSYKYTAVS